MLIKKTSCPEMTHNHPDEEGVKAVKKNYRSFVLAVFISLQSFNVAATTLLPLDIKALHQQAKLILLVESVDSNTQKDVNSGLIVTYTTFKVLDAIKGEVSKTHTIKQIGGVLPDDEGGLRVPGVPSFVSGEKYILFIPPVSKLGFSSPVGLSQGMFTLSIIENKEVISNGRDFVDLMQSIPKDSMPESVRNTLEAMPELTTSINRKRRTQMPLTDFVALIQSMK